MNHFSIRKYQPHDKEDVIKLWQICELIIPKNIPEKEIEEKMAFQPDLFFVGTINTDLIATIMIGYDGHRGWINYLAVNPKYQRMGYGTLLMDHATKLLKQMGCSKINVQIRNKNISVISFYEKKGYINDDVISFGKRL